jgi:hypothetical protein
MEENKKLIELLLERSLEYGKTSIEIAKLKALDKSSDIISSFISHSVVFVLIASFMIFLNLGLAFWLGKILGEIYIGFFVVAAFYVIAGIAFHFIFHKRLKRYICNAIIKIVLK